MGPGGDAGGDVAGTGLPSAVSAGGANLTAFGFGFRRALGLLRALSIHRKTSTVETAITHGPARYRPGRRACPRSRGDLLNISAGGGRPAGSTKGILNFRRGRQGGLNVASYRVDVTVSVGRRLERSAPARHRCPRASAAAALVVLTGVARIRRRRLLGFAVGCLPCNSQLTIVNRQFPAPRIRGPS